MMKERLNINRQNLFDFQLNLISKLLAQKHPGYFYQK